ncbi:hypothetical protein SLS57_006505 [Botryosphaeria dothidea]
MSTPYNPGGHNLLAYDSARGLAHIPKRETTFYMAALASAYTVNMMADIENAFEEIVHEELSSNLGPIFDPAVSFLVDTDHDFQSNTWTCKFKVFVTDEPEHMWDLPEMQEGHGNSRMAALSDLRWNSIGHILVKLLGE